MPLWKQEIGVHRRKILVMNQESYVSIEEETTPHIKSYTQTSLDSGVRIDRHSMESPPLSPDRRQRVMSAHIGEALTTIVNLAKAIEAVALAARVEGNETHVERTLCRRVRIILRRSKRGDTATRDCSSSLSVGLAKEWKA